MIKRDNVVGLIPAAGFATRISPLLSCSKEIYPIKNSDGESRAVASYLMDSFRKAAVEKAYLVLRTGKWDIPEHFGDGKDTGLRLAYIVSDVTKGVPQTLDKAFPFIKDNIVLLGFPDILFKPSNAFVSLLEKQKITGSDLVLGLFRTGKPEKADMMKFNDDGSIKDIIIKPEKTSLIYTWIIAAWTPVFTSFMHDYLNKYMVAHSNNESDEKSSELHIGDVVREAISDGLKTSYVTFESGKFLDIGTPSELQKVSSKNWIAHFDSVWEI